MASFDDGLTDTAVPISGRLETDVLVVGSGPAGSSVALALATAGVDVTMITKYRWTANTPRAHITNQRAMEFFRAMGIEQEVMRDATAHDLMGDTVLCTSLAGEELGRIFTWGTGPDRKSDYISASPTLPCDIPQTYLEPILVRNAVARGAHARFSTEYLSHTQDENGVTTTVLDRLTGERREIRSKYLVGCDGARSQIARDLGLPMSGAMDIAGSMNINFKADLSGLVSHRPSVLYWVIQPGSNVGGIGAGVVRMVRPWNEWLAIWGYDITQPPPVIDDEAARDIVRNLVGVPDLEVEITGKSLWGNNEMWAEKLSSGRVFCAGDAIHRHPPSNGLGSNTSIQDAQNLAWKLAAVLRGEAAPSLLETYSEERAPVAEQIVRRANKSTREFGGVFQALGMLDAADPTEMIARIESRKGLDQDAAAMRSALEDALAVKNYEFNAHGVEMGQFYRSSAIISDGSERPIDARDSELYYAPSTAPGAPLPHAWIGDERSRVSTLDVVANDGLTLVTGLSGSKWSAALGEVSDELNVTTTAVVIGPGGQHSDLYHDWARRRGMSEDGALLVRPDRIIAWRSQTMTSDPAGDLRDAIEQVLGRAS